MKIKCLVVLLIIITAFLACDEKDLSLKDSDQKVKFNLEEFNRNRDKWEAMNLLNYSYEYSNSGYSFTGTSSHIGVRMTAGKPSEVLPLVEDGIQSGDTYLIDDMFEDILNKFPTDGLANISSSVYLEEIKVVYDETYHFPLEVHYLYFRPENFIGIWDMHHFIKKFQVKK